MIKYQKETTTDIYQTVGRKSEARHFIILSLSNDWKIKLSSRNWLSKES